MTKFQYEGEPVIVCRDGGYPLAELLTPENRKKIHERVKNPNYVNSKHRLKEIFNNGNIVVNPEAMTYVHIWDYSTFKK